MQTSGSNSAASREGRRRGCLMGWGGARRGEDRDCERRIYEVEREWAWIR